MGVTTTTTKNRENNETATITKAHVQNGRTRTLFTMLYSSRVLLLVLLV